MIVIKMASSFDAITSHEKNKKTEITLIFLPSILVFFPHISCLISQTD